MLIINNLDASDFLKDVFSTSFIFLLHVILSRAKELHSGTSS